MSETPDVLIAGGGMIGAAIALGVANAGFRVAVVERDEIQLDWPEKSIDLRVSAINRASQHLLENLEVWSDEAQLAQYPYRKMRVWNTRGRKGIEFDSADIAEPNLGHIVQNRLILSALWQKLQMHDRVESHMPASVKEIQYEGDAVLLITDQAVLKGKLLVGADGANSQLRQMAGIQTHVQDFKQTAIVATVRTENHQDTAWQRFMPKGPLAFLPVTENQCSIVWTTTAKEAGQLIEMDSEAFCQLLTAKSKARLGKITATSDRKSFPLHSQHAQSYIAKHVVLAGDAAHQIHPLAGQGVNLGFADAAKLMALLIQAKENRRSISSYRLLREYERARKGDNLLMQNSMEAINWLFSNQYAGLDFARNAGLDLVNQALPMKKMFMYQALGL